MIVKQRMSLIEKILLTIVTIILVIAVIAMIAVAIWLSGRDLSFLIGG